MSVPLSQNATQQGQEDRLRRISDPNRGSKLREVHLRSRLLCKIRTMSNPVPLGPGRVESNCAYLFACEPRFPHEQRIRVFRPSEPKALPH